MSNFEEPFDEQLNSDSDFRAKIDRMVDGELSDEQQRSLLKGLEDSPSGWKTLALAYVEAATWKSHFAPQPTNVDSEKDSPPPYPTEMPTVQAATSESLTSERPDSRNESSATNVFAVVAVLLVFGLGIWLGRTQIEDPARRSQIANNATPAEDVPKNTSPQPAPDELTIVSDQHSATSIPESVQVVYSDGQSDVLRVVDVPLAASVALESPQQFDEFWSRRNSLIPPELRAELEQSGHQIRESRDFWPAQLPDGRAVVIPVSQVHVANNPLAIP